MASRSRIILSLIISFSAIHASEAEVSSAGRNFFENKIRPALETHCYECHAASSEKVGGKLLLDTREGTLTGGESGTAIVAGDPDGSLLVQALRWEHDLEMPPETPIPEAVLLDFIQWVKMGAPDPRSGKSIQLAGRQYEEQALWSFKPLTNPTPPEFENADWSRDPIDLFVHHGIETMGLSAVDVAPPEMLIRRLHYDLTGLPPTYDRVREFRSNCQDNRQLAIEELVDDLLASPGFGERWGRHWLDVARFAESNGNDGLSRNPSFPHAWRYRDYVIDAFNSDTPYDRFLTEQIAGDLISADSPKQRDRQLVATGFLALGAKPAKAMNNNFAMDVVADQIDAIGTGILGLSIACARCHDHKFDPIPTRDYYAMAGFFTSTETLWGVAAHEKLTAPVTDLHVLESTPHVPPPADFKETVVNMDLAKGVPKPIPKSKWKSGTPLAMGVRDRKKPADCKVNLKGDAKKLGESIPRGIPTAYEFGPEVSITNRSSGRLELAKWLTDPSHPHTSRVMVNRIWMHLFGRGIVGTPDDFGVYGERPTHPELLDHLATRFVEDGWSIKRLIRSIVLTRTYQLSSFASQAAFQSDPENRWLARHSRRRRDAESLRDSILNASGNLDVSRPSGSIIRHRDILINIAGASLHQPSNHRSVYLCYLRNSPPPELAAFDLPAFIKPASKRETSTIPGQGLFLYNNPFVIEQAGQLSQKVRESSRKTTSRILSAYQMTLNRDPNPEELYRAQELIRQVQSESNSEPLAWTCLCQALLTTSEFRYID
tara:strand:+ start:587 stop:2905 length:2319 start_codon:yes stop_codon:yes gene_type:complete